MLLANILLCALLAVDVVGLAMSLLTRREVQKRLNASLNKMDEGHPELLGQLKAHEDEQQRAVLVKLAEMLSEKMGRPCTTEEAKEISERASLSQHADAMLDTLKIERIDKPSWE